jgi:hypothetical protein
VPSLSLSGALLRRARGYSDGVAGGPDEPLLTDSARAEEHSHGRHPGHHHRHRGEDREGAGEGEGRAEGTSTRSGSPQSGDDDSGDVLGSGSDSDLWTSDEERDMGESAGCFLNRNGLCIRLLKRYQCSPEGKLSSTKTKANDTAAVRVPSRAPNEHLLYLCGWVFT